MKKVTLELIETVNSAKYYEIGVPDDWTSEKIRKEIIPTDLLMYQASLPSGVTIISSEGDWKNQDLDIMGLGALRISRINNDPY
jgi:hypothetical protein